MDEYVRAEVYVDILYDMDTGDIRSRLSVGNNGQLGDNVLYICRVATHMTLRQMSAAIADIARKKRTN